MSIIDAWVAVVFDDDGRCGMGGGCRGKTPEQGFSGPWGRAEKLKTIPPYKQTKAAIGLAVYRAAVAWGGGCMRKTPKHASAAQCEWRKILKPLPPIRQSKPLLCLPVIWRLHS